MSRKLTLKEELVVEELKKGKTDIEIASKLGMKPGTVRAHLHSIYLKEGVSSRTQLLVRLLTDKVNKEGLNE